MTVTGLAVAALIAALAALAGRAAGDPWHHPEDPASDRWALALLAGVAGLYLWLQLLDLAGLRWTRLSVAVPLGALAAVGLLRARRAAPAAVAPPLGLGDLAVAGALAVFAVAMVAPCATMSDFVYHWGIKARRFALAGGFDAVFLTRPWNFNKHADYPNLVPAVDAAAILLRGRFELPAVLAWSALWGAVLALAARGALAAAGVGRWAAQGTAAAVVMAYVLFAVGYVLSGSPDLLFAVLPVVALPALLRPPSAAGDARIGLVAAVAVGTKMEGGPLALALVGVQLVRRWRAGKGFRPGVALRLLLPPLLVAAPWWLKVAGHRLAQGNRVAGFDPARLPIVAQELALGMGEEVWHGLAWCLLLLPALLLRREVRPLAAVLTAQLGLYLWVYLTTPVATAFLVRSSQQRLIFHLLPAVLLLTGIALGRWRRAGP